MENINTILPSAGFHIEKILAISVRGEENLRFYKVQWAPSWVADGNLIKCDKLIDEFLNGKQEEEHQSKETGETLSSEIKIEYDDGHETGQLSSLGCPLNSSGDIPSEIGLTSNNDSNDHVEDNVEFNNVLDAGHSSNLDDIEIDISDTSLSSNAMCNQIINTGVPGDLLEKTRGQHIVSDVVDAQNLIDNENILLGSNDGRSIDKTHSFGIGEYSKNCSQKKTSIPKCGGFDAIKGNKGAKINTAGSTRNRHSSQIVKMDGYNSNNESIVKNFYKCYSCPKVFARKFQMMRHYTSHTKPFRCDICQKPFGRKDNLKRHRGQHTKQLTVECKFCFKTYKTKKRFLRHLLEHKNEELDVNLIHNMEDNNLLSNNEIGQQQN